MSAERDRKLRCCRHGGPAAGQVQKGGASGEPPDAAPTRAQLDEAAEAYSAFLGEAYGLTGEEVGIPDSYEGREVDWFGDVNEVLHQLDGYEPREVAAILRRRDPRLGEDETLLSCLRAGNFNRAHEVLRRM